MENHGLRVECRFEGERSHFMKEARELEELAYATSHVMTGNERRDRPMQFPMPESCRSRRSRLCRKHASALNKADIAF